MKISHHELAAFIPLLKDDTPKTLLHIGCGQANPERLPECFKVGTWKELTLDIDPRVQPDIVATITDMTPVAADSVDAVWSSHNLEHLEGYQVHTAMQEIHRVLKPGGFVLITLPDVQKICQIIANGGLEEVLYRSPVGPITPLDVLFGHQDSIARGNTYMAHRTAFDAARLSEQLHKTGFNEIRVRKGNAFDLWAVALKEI